MRHFDKLLLYNTKSPMVCSISIILCVLVKNTVSFYNFISKAMMIHGEGT